MAPHQVHLESEEAGTVLPDTMRMQMRRFTPLTNGFGIERCSSEGVQARAAVALSVAPCRRDRCGVASSPSGDATGGLEPLLFDRRHESLAWPALAWPPARSAPTRGRSTLCPRSSPGSEDSGGGGSPTPLPPRADA